MKKIIGVLLSICLTVCLFTSCGRSEKTVRYNADVAMSSLSSMTVASNEKFELMWNEKGNFVGLYDKTANKIWSTTPYEYFESGGTSNNVNSPINITVVNAAKAQWDTVNGYTESVEKNKVSVKKIDNGLEITYYFDSYLISVPVRYELTKDGLAVSINSSEIAEDGDLKLMSVSLLPFLCSTPNNENSYLFVPSGSGALMYADERVEGTRKFAAEVYGEDLSRLVPEETADNTRLTFPVYGVKDGDTALLAIIEQGAEQAEINAEAGNRRTGYSTVYATFYFRGYDVVETDQWLWGYRDLNRISDEMVNTVISVSYCPLSGNQADYNGMAALTRKFVLGATKSIEPEKSPLYSLDILGGVRYKSAAWGIPHKKLYVLTSFDDARKMIHTFYEKTGLPAAAVMRGFSSGGLDIGKIGGGFSFGDAYGNSDDLSRLLRQTQETGVTLAFDFDLVRYSRSSVGFSYLMDAAESPTLRTVRKYGINVPLRSYDNEEYRLLKRAKLNSAVERLISCSNKSKLTAVSLFTLSNAAYSDFGDSQYSVKRNMAAQVAESIENIKQGGKLVFVSGANSYAASAADIVLNTPDDNGDYFAFDKTIPFYQMVFIGAKPLYSTALNLSENISKSVMQAVSTGVRFGFTIAENDDMQCAGYKAERIYGTRYKSVLSDAVSLITEYDDYYRSIAGQTIEDYQWLSDKISLTFFSNGIKVYANHSNAEVETDIGVFKPYGIAIVK